MVEVDPERFEALVAAALDELPGPLAEGLDNVVVRIRTGRPTASLPARSSPATSCA